MVLGGPRSSGYLCPVPTLTYKAFPKHRIFLGISRRSQLQSSSFYQVAMLEKHRGSFEDIPLQSSADTESCQIQEYEGGEGGEGGSAAWLTVGGSILVYYASFGIMNTFGFFQNYYKTEFLKDCPTATIAFIGTIQMAFANSLAAVSGALCDRYGVKVSFPYTRAHQTPNLTQPCICNLTHDSTCMPGLVRVRSQPCYSSLSCSLASSGLSS